MDAGEPGNPLGVVADLRHPRVEVVQNRVAVDDRLPEPLASPDSASAVAVSVWFSLTGSTFYAIEVTVSNSVLNSIVTDDTSITSPLEIRCAAGSSGELNDTYLLPNTVVALMSANTLAGMKSM